MRAEDSVCGSLLDFFISCLTAPAARLSRELFWMFAIPWGGAESEMLRFVKWNAVRVRLFALFLRLDLN